ncbi:Uncharacterized protein TCM_003654 [Theobroma cacao]|uniref:Uncharacterized protein n=1 Tax=Theobroma cacao TaxID=3641 RepID=A0A061DP79_THECC|nr:Uncharacterized protein TCM_003654 [Theobroma cacao]
MSTNIVEIAMAYGNSMEAMLPDVIMCELTGIVSKAFSRLNGSFPEVSDSGSDRGGVVTKVLSGFEMPPETRAVIEKILK